MFFWQKKPKKMVEHKPAVKAPSTPKKPNCTMQKERPRPAPLKRPEPRPIPPKHERPAPPKKPENRCDPKKDFLRTFEKLTIRHNPWTVWSDFITMFACALSNPVDKDHYDEREQLYLKIIARYGKNEQNLFPDLAAFTVLGLENNPEQDFLGSLYMQLNLGNDHKGQFFTPYHVCELMAKVTLGDIQGKVKEQGFITINDPACGAGAMLIAAINEAKRLLEEIGLNHQNHILIMAQDIDSITALMCYIQLSLLGVAGIVKIGNTLTEPMRPEDSQENYWYTAMYFSDVWKTRRLYNIYKELGGNHERQ